MEIKTALMLTLILFFNQSSSATECYTAPFSFNYYVFLIVFSSLDIVYNHIIFTARVIARFRKILEIN